MRRMERKGADAPSNHVPGKEGGPEGGRGKGPITRAGPGTRKNDTLWCDVCAKGRAVGLEQSGAIKTGHGSEGPSRPSASRRWGEGARWGPFTLSNLLQYFQSSAAYSRSVSARFFASFCPFTRDPLGQITFAILRNGSFQLCFASHATNCPSELPVRINRKWRVQLISRKGIEKWCGWTVCGNKCEIEDDAVLSCWNVDWSKVFFRIFFDINEIIVSGSRVK